MCLNSHFPKVFLSAQPWRQRDSEKVFWSSWENSLRKWGFSWMSVNFVDKSIKKSKYATEIQRPVRFLRHEWVFCTEHTKRPFLSNTKKTPTFCQNICLNYMSELSVDLQKISRHIDSPDRSKKVSSVDNGGLTSDWQKEGLGNNGKVRIVTVQDVNLSCFFFFNVGWLSLHHSCFFSLWHFTAGDKSGSKLLF